MAKLTVDEIFEGIKELNVLELVTLKNKLQDEFGVSAAPPMMGMPMMMPGAAAAGGGEAAAPAAPEEPTSFDVILTSFGEKKINVIKVVREVTSLGLKEAKDLVDGVPSKIKEGLNKDEAEALKTKFEAEGAKVEIKPSA